MLEYVSADAMAAKFVSHGLIPQVVSTLKNLWENKFPILTARLLSQAASQSKLVDLDWSFGVTVANEDCHQVGKSYLQLKLVLSSSPGEKNREVFVELSMDQFYKFLASLEKCKALVDLLTTMG